MTQELWPRGHTSSADFDDSEILEECVLHLEQNKMAHLDAIRAARALDSQFDVCDDDDDERGEYGGEADDEAKKKWAASQKRSPSRASSEPLFDVGDIPVYLTDEDQDFQRVRIDEIKDDNMCDSDAVLGSSQLFRAFELHQKWTSEFQRTEGEVSAGTSLPPSPASPKRTIRGAGAAANHNAENDKRHRRRGDPVYDPLAAEHVAKGLEKLPGVVKSMNGVYRHCANEESNEALDADEYWMPSFLDFSVAFAEVKAMVNSGPVKTLAYKRLAVLEQRFSLHVLLNGERELSTQKSVPHRDFYNVRKVDTHVHHSACMNQKHLLRFIKAKLRKNGSEVVTNRDGRDLTLADVFKTLRLTAYDLSIDTLDMHAHDTFHRFDRFNLKYNPAGQSRLREIFLKTDNLIKGRYLAELTREVMSDLEASKYQLAEWRVSIYGRAPSDWAGLADWFFDHALASPNVRWMIQVPRLYAVYRAAGLVKSFDEILQNIFEPLFAVTLDPASNPRLHAFLEAIVGFDSVDDESKPDAGAMDPTRPLPLPKEWTRPEEPPFAYVEASRRAFLKGESSEESYRYWMYHMYANLRALNRVRAARHLSTFECAEWRPKEEPSPKSPIRTHFREPEGPSAGPLPSARA